MLNQFVFQGNIASVKLQRKGDQVRARIMLIQGADDHKVVLWTTLFGKSAEAVIKYKDVGDELIVEGQLSNFTPKGAKYPELQLTGRLAHFTGHASSNKDDDDDEADDWEDIS